MPLITSAEVTGRGTARPIGGITYPMRFRFVHDAGQAFRGYIELTAFGIPVMKVNETYRDGHARDVTPFGIDEGAKVDPATGGPSGRVDRLPVRSKEVST